MSSLYDKLEINSSIIYDSILYNYINIPRVKPEFSQRNVKKGYSLFLYLKEYI